MTRFFESDGTILVGRLKIDETKATNVPDKDEVFVYGASFDLIHDKYNDKVAKIEVTFENDLDMVKAPCLLEDIFCNEQWGSSYYFDNLKYYYVEGRDE